METVDTLSTMQLYWLVIVLITKEMISGLLETLWELIGENGYIRLPRETDFSKVKCA